MSFTQSKNFPGVRSNRFLSRLGWALLLGFALTGALSTRLLAAIQINSTLTPVKLNFSVPQKGETQIVLDLVVLDVSDHPPQSYEILIKGYELYRDGKLLDKIPPG